VEVKEWERRKDIERRGGDRVVGRGGERGREREREITIHSREKIPAPTRAIEMTMCSHQTIERGRETKREKREQKHEISVLIGVTADYFVHSVAHMHCVVAVLTLSTHLSLPSSLFLPLPYLLPPLPLSLSFIPLPSPTHHLSLLEPVMTNTTSQWLGDLPHF
jgi:hypothetical protein